MPDHNETHTEKYKNHTISILYDATPMNPRTEFDNLGTMICFHRRYDLGDPHDYTEPAEAVASICDIDTDDILCADSITEAMDEALDAAPLRWLPLYLYDHSGITMNTTGFSCAWDSGQVGIIYVTDEDVNKEWPIKFDELPKNHNERILNYLRSEVATYDAYISGDVYGYIITKEDPDNEGETIEVESCWGFYGYYEDKNGCLAQAREAVDAIVKPKK